MDTAIRARPGKQEGKVTCKQNLTDTIDQPTAEEADRTTSLQIESTPEVANRHEILLEFTEVICIQPRALPIL